MISTRSTFLLFPTGADGRHAGCRSPAVDGGGGGSAAASAVATSAATTDTVPRGSAAQTYSLSSLRTAATPISLTAFTTLAISLRRDNVTVAEGTFSSATASCVCVCACECACACVCECVCVCVCVLGGP